MTWEIIIKTSTMKPDIKISHLGAENCVTGSCHLVQTQKTSILVDCGRAYGHDSELPFEKFPVPPSSIEYLFLTHAHIDHIGRVPDLIEAGFNGEIICTTAVPTLRSVFSITY